MTQTAWCPKHRIQPIVNTDRSSPYDIRNRRAGAKLVYGDLACGDRYGIVTSTQHLAEIETQGLTAAPQA